MQKIKNVLVACEESQIVCSAFRELGCNAYSCDLKECSGGHPEWHIQGDVLQFLNPREFMPPDTFYFTIGIPFVTMDNRYHEVNKWDLIIAHPPCTFLTKASACRMYPKAGCIDKNRLAAAFRAREFFMHCLAANCDRICVENPTPLKVVGLPQHSQVIQPYMFGHPFSKRTLLWLKGLPCLEPTNILSEYKPFLPSCTSRFKGTDYNIGTVYGSSVRSKTFPGIAAAMASQWLFEV